jgi:hypothetical protein
MDIFALPKEYYATEKKPIHIIGYSAALALALIGVVETIHSVPYIVKGETNLNSTLLGPVAVGAGLFSASMYLKQAGIQAGY